MATHCLLEKVLRNHGDLGLIYSFLKNDGRAHADNAAADNLNDFKLVSIQ